MNSIRIPSLPAPAPRRALAGVLTAVLAASAAAPVRAQMGPMGPIPDPPAAAFLDPATFCSGGNGAPCPDVIPVHIAIGDIVGPPVDGGKAGPPDGWPDVVVVNQDPSPHALAAASGSFSTRAPGLFRPTAWSV